MITRSFVVSLFLVACSWTAGFAQESSPRNGIMHLEIEGVDPISGDKLITQGVGVLISKEGHVLTSGELMKSLHARSTIGTKISGRPGGILGDRLALDFVEDSDGFTLLKARLPVDYLVEPLELAKGTIGASDNSLPISVHWFDARGNARKKDGTSHGLKQVNKDRWQIDIAPRPGMIGAPILGPSGTVLAIVQESSDTGWDFVEVLPARRAGPLTSFITLSKLEDEIALLREENSKLRQDIFTIFGDSSKQLKINEENIFLNQVVMMNDISKIRNELERITKEYEVLSREGQWSVEYDLDDKIMKLRFQAIVDGKNHWDHVKIKVTPYVRFNDGEISRGPTTRSSEIKLNKQGKTLSAPLFRETRDIVRVSEIYDGIVTQLEFRILPVSVNGERGGVVLVPLGEPHIRNLFTSDND